MPKRALTKEDVIKRLLQIKGDRPNAALAAEFGVSKQYMGKLLKGLEIPGPSILEPLKLRAEKTVIYREVA